MNNLFFRGMLLLAGFASLASHAAVPVAVSGREYAETSLLLSNREVDMRFGIKSLYKQDAIKPFSLDLLAELAWGACSGTRHIKPDTLAWIAKTIGKSKQGRYGQLIDDCLDKTKATDKSLIKYLTEAKMALADASSSDHFVGGNLDLDKVRDDLLKNRKTVPVEPLARKQLESMESGLRMDDVYSRLGAPGHISAMSVPRGKAGFLYVKVRLSDDRIVFHYPELGDVRFGFDNSAGDWILADATSMHGMYWLAKDGRFVNTSVAITEGDSGDLLLITKSLLRQQEPIEDTLFDRIADRIYLSQKESDDSMVKALAHMCKLLGRSDNGKYKQMMREVSETAVHKSLRKYAALAADSLPDTGEQQYNPLKGANL